MTLIQAPASLKKIFWAGVCALGLHQALTVTPESTSLVLVAIAVSVLAFFPAWLWCSQRIKGLPLFPVLAMTYVPTFALPLLQPTLEAARYSVESRVDAGLTVCLFLFITSLVWYSISSRISIPRQYWAFKTTKTSGIFVGFILVADIFFVVMYAGWLPQDIGGGTFAVLRSVTIGLASLGSSIMAYRLGKKQLTSGTKTAFVIALCSLMILHAVSLTLIGAMTLFVISAAMYALGSGRLPLVSTLVMGTLVVILHAGKGHMRNEYWYSQKVIEPTEIPALYGEWFSVGLNNLLPGSSSDRKSEKTTSLVDRSSVLQMLLLVMDKTDGKKPFLMGRTYEIIPELMVPRFLLEEKMAAHEGTYMLSIHFDRQTRKETRRSTIGFGHVAEAYANFGYIGVIGLSIVTGLLIGWITRWSATVPIDSFRGLVGLLFLGLVVQTEHTAGVTAAAISQGMQLLIVFTIVFMEPVRSAQSE